MPNKPSAAKLRAQQQAKEFLENPSLLPRVYQLEPLSPEAQSFVNDVSSVYETLSSLDRIIDFATRMLVPGSPAAIAYEDLRARLKSSKAEASTQSGAATHREKRHFINSSGLNGHGKTIADIIASQGEPTVGSVFNPRIIWRNPGVPAVPRCTVLADVKCRIENDHVVNEANGYFIPGPSESVIFLAGTADKPVKENGEYAVQLVVLQGVLVGTPMSRPVYDWMSDVIATAVIERRDVRPNHEGSMIQAGYNAGPRHARVFGLAKSYNKVLDHATMVKHDEDIIATLALTWGVLRAFLPSDVLATVDRHLLDAGLPSFGTRNVESGRGYRLTLNGKEYKFPDCDRGPCEILLAQNYSAWSHTDDCFTEFCLDWTVDRQDRSPSSGQDTPAPVHRMQTRHQLRHNAPQPPAGLEPEPAAGGGNFVDLALKVKIPMTTGTVLAFRPDHMHGTTRLCGAKIRSATISSATRILDAFNMAKQGVIEPGAGAGEGSD